MGMRRECSRPPFPASSLCTPPPSLSFLSPQDYKVHIKHTDGSFEYIPYFCLPGALPSEKVLCALTDLLVAGDRAAAAGPWVDGHWHESPTSLVWLMLAPPAPHAAGLGVRSPPALAPCPTSNCSQ